MSAEEILLLLMTGGNPGNQVILQFCKEASESQLRQVLTRDNAHSLSLHDLGLIENELENRHRAETLRLQQEIAAKVDELKKPNWTLVPTFWLVLVGTVSAFIFGILGCIIGYLGLEQSNKPHPAAIVNPSAVSPIPQKLPPAPETKLLAPVKKVTNSPAAPASPKK